MILPMELCKPLLMSASSVRDRDDAEEGNTGPKYHLEVKALREIPEKKRPKNTALIVCPYVHSNTGLTRSGIDAAARLDVIANQPGQPDWWYRHFHEPFG